MENKDVEKIKHAISAKEYIEKHQLDKVQQELDSIKTLGVDNNERQIISDIETKLKKANDNYT